MSRAQVLEIWDYCFGWEHETYERMEAQVKKFIEEHGERYVMNAISQAKSYETKNLG